MSAQLNDRYDVQRQHSRLLNLRQTEEQLNRMLTSIEDEVVAEQLTEAIRVTRCRIRALKLGMR